MKMFFLNVLCHGNSEGLQQVKYRFRNQRCTVCISENSHLWRMTTGSTACIYLWWQDFKNRIIWGSLQPPLIFAYCVHHTDKLTIQWEIKKSLTSMKKMQKINPMRPTPALCVKRPHIFFFVRLFTEFLSQAYQVKLQNRSLRMVLVASFYNGCFAR